MTVVAPRTAKSSTIFERGENLLQNGISQSSEIVLQSYRIYTDEKLTFMKGVWYLKG